MKVIIIILLVLLILFINNINEYFYDLYYVNNMRHTKRMSYDLRGDPIIIPRKEYLWNNVE